MTKKLETPRQVVTALGGPKQAAKLLGVKYRSTVANWIKRGRIPATYYQRIKLYLEQRSYEVSPKAFGFHPMKER